MSYIAINEVKSTTIKTGKGGASPCNPSIRATLFNRGLWSKLESKGSLACGRFCRLGSLSSGRYVLRALVGFFFLQRDSWIICPTPGHDHLYFDSVLTIFTPAKDWSRYHCFSLPTMFDHGRRWCESTVVYDSLWPWYVISSWPWYIANHGYKINQCFLLNQWQQITK